MEQRLAAVSFCDGLSEFHTKSFLDFISDWILDTVDLICCESLVHGSVGYSVAVALLLCLGMSEVVNELHLKINVKKKKILLSP